MRLTILNKVLICIFEPTRLAYFKGPMKSVFIKLYFLVLLYWLVWIKNNFKCFEWIINCLSNNQKFTPPNFQSFNEMFVTYTYM